MNRNVLPIAFSICWTVSVSSTFPGDKKFIQQNWFFLDKWVIISHSNLHFPIQLIRLPTLFLPVSFFLLPVSLSLSEYASHLCICPGVWKLYWCQDDLYLASHSPWKQRSQALQLMLNLPFVAILVKLKFCDGSWIIFFFFSSSKLQT